MWSVGDDRSPLQNLLNTMCNPPHKWMVAKLSFVLREIATEFISLKLYKETRRSIRWVFELKGDIWSCGGRGFGCKKYFGKKFVHMKSKWSTCQYVHLHFAWRQTSRINGTEKWMVAKVSFVLREIATEFVSLKLYKEIAQIHQASFRMERWTSEVVVREVSAVRNIPERNPF